MAVIEGRCPHTGDVLAAECAGDTIARVTRRPGGETDLPWLLPGLIDLQVNGYAGHDVNGPTASADEVAALTHALAARGVTTWVPTVITAAEDGIIASLRAVEEARAADPAVAAAIPYVHVEGPFLSEHDGPRGAHELDQIRPLDADEVARWAEHGRIGYVTVSPHTPDAADHVARIVASGILVSLGHTHATPEQLRDAVDAGASLSTHLGNGIFAELPRHPNPIWTQLADDRLTCGFIGDGHHLPADALTAMIRAKCPGRAFLVSDSVALAGSPPGRYETPVGGTVELSADGRLALAGTSLLAGSGVDLAHVLAWVLGHTPFSVAEVAALTSTVPASVLGATHLGRVQAGARGDLVLVDRAGTVVRVVRQGRDVEVATPSTAPPEGAS